MNILYSQEARNKMLMGIDTIANAVKGTLGPKGRNAALYQKANIRGAQYADAPMPGAHVLITNDGVTVAQSMVLADPVEDAGVRLLKNAADKTNEIVGDGTTTTIVLTQVLLHQLHQSIAAGADPLALRRGMKKAEEVVVQDLQEMAVPIQKEEEIAAVAAISCQDEELGKIIARAYAKVGLEGVITLEDSGRPVTTMEIQEGIVFDRGYIDDRMCTDKEQRAAELQNPYILLCDTKFTEYQQLLPFLIMAAEDDRSCLIISEGVEGSALGLIHRNRQEGDMQIVCVNAPEYGEGRKWRMEDLALQTGGVYISSQFMLDVKDVTREMVGTARYVKVTKKQTMILDPAGDPEKISSRIKELRYLAQHTDYDFNRQRYRERLAKFVSGVAKIDVGGVTEPEIWERKMRMEDGIHTCRAAMEEGVVSGGGIALLNVTPKVQTLAEQLEDDERAGAMAVFHALKVPARQILENAGANGRYLTERLFNRDEGIGYDIDTWQEIHMLEAGIMDPVKVTRMAFENAVSVAGTLATAEAVCTAEEGKGK